MNETPTNSRHRTVVTVLRTGPASPPPSADDTFQIPALWTPSIDSKVVLSELDGKRRGARVDAVRCEIGADRSITASVFLEERSEFDDDWFQN